MPSITAQFLFAGFTQYLAQNQSAIDAVNSNFSGGGQIESAYLLETIAAAADQHVAFRQKTFPGVWEYEIVEPFGSTLAEWSAKGQPKTLAEMIEVLNSRTDAWIESGTVPALSPVVIMPESASPSESRGRLTAITCNTKNGRGIHFCNDLLLNGSNFNLWFPVSADETWFVAIERILLMNGVAQNVTSVVALRECEEYTDFEIIFNRPVY